MSDFPLPSKPVAEPHPHAAVAPPKTQKLRFDRRLLLVYGLLLLDVVVIGTTSLQHVWQPANLIDKVLQNHSTSLLPHSPAPRHELPVAVKRELGMSCCCGWLALAVMGTLSLLLSYSPSAVPAAAVSTPSSPAADSQRKGHNGTSVRRRRSSPERGKQVTSCSNCRRVLDEVELQVKLKYLLVAVATFCVFFALNLVVQIHGRFQQSKVTVTAFKTFSAENTECDLPAAGAGYGHDMRLGNQQRYDMHHQGFHVEGLGASACATSSFNPNTLPFDGTDPTQAKAEAHEGEGSAHPQSPPYFYWRDFFFWVELGRECFFDSEVQVSGLWVVLHAATLLGGRGVLRSRSAVLPSPL